MVHDVILPADPSIFQHPMVKFVFTSDDYLVSFVVQGKLSLQKLTASLNEISQEDLNEIIKIVLEYYAEAEIGETEFSEVTSVATIKRVLPSKD